MKRFYQLIIVFSFCAGGCGFGNEENFKVEGNLETSVEGSDVTSAGLQCYAQPEQTNYTIFKMHNDGTRIGDVMPYYDQNSGKFLIYHLKDIWNDATHQRHPVYAFTSNNFYDYTESTEIISSSNSTCEQDFAIGTGCVIKRNSTYYGFYTGHNPNSGGCSTPKEGIMLATSSNPLTKFTKSKRFSTIYAPKNQGFDENDNFRDPFVFLDNGTYYMLVSARKNVNGIWKGVIVRYSSSNLMNWTYQGVLYDGGNEIFFNMECAEIFQMGNHYYLLFSDQGSQYVYYRKSTSIDGPWELPAGPQRFEGKGGIYSAKTAIDVYGDRYLFGWNKVLDGNSDTGHPLWGGNLVVHKLYPKPNGDLAVAIPHTVEAYLQNTHYNIIKHSQWGNVTNTIPGTHSYRVVSNASFDVANVIFEPVNKNRYKISTTVSYSSSSKDFGFMIGACDGYNDFYSLRFVPSQNRFSFDKKFRGNMDSSTVPDNDIPLNLSPNTDYKVDIVIENSTLIVYINYEVALTTRIYKARNTHWGIFADHSDATFRNITVTHP